MFKHDLETYDKLFNELKTDLNTVSSESIQNVISHFNSPMDTNFVKELFTLVDLDRSDSLSKQEFVQFCYIIENQIKAKDTPRCLFCFADVDFSGDISADEFVWIMHKIIGKFDDNEMKEAFAETVDGGDMDFDTFVMLMKEF